VHGRNGAGREGAGGAGTAVKRNPQRRGKRKDDSDTCLRVDESQESKPGVEGILGEKKSSLKYEGAVGSN